MKPVARSILAVAALATVLAALAAAVLRFPRRMNVVLVTVDTLRADHLGVYGHVRDTSPNVDRLAKESVVFRRAYSQAPETNPSLASLMTSHFPHETQVMRNFHKLRGGALTVAEILRERGYRTAAFVSNFTLRRGSGFEQGFDTYDDRTEDWGSRLWEGYERVAPKTTAAATAWLRQNHEERFFLWVHYMDPHGPYTPPPPYDSMFAARPIGETRSLTFNDEATGKGGIVPYARLGAHTDLQYYISQYDGEIRFFDESCGRLLDVLEELGLLRSSLVVFTADHGEGLGEHDYYFDHLEFLHQGLIHVPLFIRFPGESQAGSEVAYPVAGVDVLPTILDALSIAHPRAFRGRNLFSPESRQIFAETHYRGSKRVLITGGLKLVAQFGRFELYDLRKDPGETTDLLERAAEPDFARVEALTRRMTEIAESDLLGLGSPDNWRLDLEAQRKLRALGYVQ